MKYHIGYKCVSGTPGKWESYSVSDTKYVELAPTKRRKGWGPLAVFETLEAAKKFDSFAIIFRCLYIKSRARTFWRVLDGSVVKGSQSLSDKAYADEVILIERVA